MICPTERISMLLANLFAQPDVNPQQARLKTDSLERLHEAFQFLDHQNYEEFFSYLEDWILQEPDDNNLELLVDKLAELRAYLSSSGKNMLLLPIFKLFIYLLQQEGKAVREKTLRLAIETMSTPEGSQFIKKPVKKLIQESSSWHGYDSALHLFAFFRERFYEKDEYVQVLSSANLYKNFHSRKAVSLGVMRLAELDISRGLLTALIAANSRLQSDEDEIIQTNSLKNRILLMLKELELQVSTCERCFDQLLPYYQREEMRIKFCLIEMTPQLVKVLSKEGLRLHYNYLGSNIKAEEPEISELVINNLHHIFHFASIEDQELLLKKLLPEKSDKPEKEEERSDLEYRETIARNVIKLLMHMEREEILLSFLNSFMDKQKDHVKLTLLKSFFQHESCRHLYRHFTPILDQLFRSKTWRTRLESLELLQRLLQLFEMEESIVLRLYQLIILDRAYRVRVSAIKLVLPHLSQPAVVHKLIPAILKESTNCNYLIRLTVLFFIQETYLMVLNTEVAALYLTTMDRLSHDPVTNVSSLAQAMISQLQLRQAL